MEQIERVEVTEMDMVTATGLPVFTGATSATGLINPRLSNSLGDVMRRRRKQLDMSQHDLAEAVGLGPWLIKQIERGADEPTIAMRRAIAVALHLDADDLRGLPMTDTPPAARPRPNADRIFAASAPRRQEEPPVFHGLHTFFHVVVSEGEGELRRDLAAAMRTIEQAPVSEDDRFLRPYLETAQHLMTGDGRWFTSVLRYQALADLFPATDEPRKTGDDPD